MRNKGTFRPNISPRWLSPRRIWTFLRRSLGRLAFETPRWTEEVSRSIYKPKSKVSAKNFLNPAYWIVWSCKFAFNWVRSRPIQNLTPAVPAIILSIAILLLLYFSRFDKNTWREEQYRTLLTQSFTDGDSSLSRLVLSKLILIRPDQTEFRIQKALLDDKLGYRQDAIDSMAELAEKAKNPVAALWLAFKSFDLKDVPRWSAEKHLQFRSLMETALSDKQVPTIFAARVEMAKYLLALGATSDAIRILEDTNTDLETVTKEKSDLLLFTANLHVQEGNQQRAEYWARLAEKYYREKLAVTPADIDLRLNLAHSLLILGREQEVAKTLSDGFAITRDSQLLTAGGEALASWANRIEKSEPKNEQNFIRRLQLLKRAAELAPNNLLVLESLMNITIQCSEFKNNQITALSKALLNGVEADKMHFILGTVDLLQGRIEEANVHLQLAAANMENMPGVLNNLAVVLYQRENPDLERALALSNASLKILPDHPYFRETRGQILLRMKQYNMSILDLEFALSAKELQQPIHASLAKAYAAIGVKDMSEIHRKLAKEKDAAKEPPEDRPK